MRAVALVLVLVLLAVSTANAGSTVSGLASWYGGARHEGHRMANGCPFRAAAITAAHRTLPLGTLVRVTANGRSVDVPITDRGPFIHGRVLDLSQAAFARLDRLAAGVVRMQLEVISVRPAVRRCH
jgi:rare lipoprotein A